MLTVKRILAALILWAGADMVAMGVLTTVHVVSIEGRSAPISGAWQLFIWVLVSIAVGIACFRFSWARVK